MLQVYASPLSLSNLPNPCSAPPEFEVRVVQLKNSYIYTFQVRFPKKHLKWLKNKVSYAIMMLKDINIK